MWILDDEPIKVSFDTGGYTLYQGSRGLLAAPVTAHQRLVAVKGGEEIEITGPRDLQERVTLKSPEEALEFVRLFTSIETGHMFPTIEYVEATVADDETDLAQYSREYERSMKLPPVSAIRKNDGFEIERNVIDPKGRLLRQTEHVGEGGDYSIIKTTVLDEHSPAIYPIYQ